MTGTRLLLVDDDPDNLTALSTLLSERYAVFPYTCPLEALRALDAARPDVIVLDIGMRPVDGLQCLQRIRGSAHRSVPAVALTGYGGPDERQRFLEGGFQAVVTKPIHSSAELIALIDQLGARSALPAAIARLDGAEGATASSRGEPEQAGN